MSEQSYRHFPELFLQSLRQRGGEPLFYERHAKIFLGVTYKEVAAQTNLFARALCAVGLEKDARLTIHAEPSPKFWISELAALSVHANVVVVPQRFSVEELVEVLLETKSRMVIVSSFQRAKELAQVASELPELRHIVCFNGKLDGPLPIMDWQDFRESGRAAADYTARLCSELRPEDTAILFYSLSTRAGGYHVKRYSHQQLLEYAEIITNLLGDAHRIKEGNIIFSSPEWDYPTEHIASCFLPLLKRCAIQIHNGDIDPPCFDRHPNILIAPSFHLEELRQHIESVIKGRGRLEWKMLMKTLKNGKQHYESANKIRPWRRLQDSLLKATIGRKVSQTLGGKLRFIIGVDDQVKYDTLLFFHAFGMELVEIPGESFKHII